MARIIESFEFKAFGGGKESHDWESLADGKIRELVQGDDFQCKPASFQQQARNYAKKHNMKVRVSMNKAEGKVVLQFVPADATPAPEAPEAPAPKRSRKK